MDYRNLYALPFSPYKLQTVCQFYVSAVPTINKSVTKALILHYRLLALYIGHITATQ